MWSVFSFKLEVKGLTCPNSSLSNPSHYRATLSCEFESDRRSTLMTTRFSGVTCSLSLSLSCYTTKFFVWLAKACGLRMEANSKGTWKALDGKEKQMGRIAPNVVVAIGEVSVHVEFSIVKMDDFDVVLVWQVCSYFSCYKRSLVLGAMLGATRLW